MTEDRDIGEDSWLVPTVRTQHEIKEEEEEEEEVYF